ncbi:MAG: hypothetical protein HC802_17755 [Caldilineaceae bacterium]|nr:hypothetical protein [Caldilineaceae bacterium]
MAALIAITLLAASPSFVFWSRQGIFVTNLTQPLVFACLWQGVRWLHTSRLRHLLWAAFFAGLALYAKLLAIWVVGPFALMSLGWWWWLRRNCRALAPRLSIGGLAAAFGLFLLPLTPFWLFNWQTAGTVTSVTDNLRQSYYGVDNLALLQNLTVRGGQLFQTLRGDHFWYLGGLFANMAAPWLAVGAVVVGLWRAPRLVIPPVVLLAATLILSLFTVSDLFITHYALIQPLAVAVVGLGLSAWLGKGAKRSTAGAMPSQPSSSPGSCWTSPRRRAIIAH